MHHARTSRFTTHAVTLIAGLALTSAALAQSAVTTTPEKIEDQLKGSYSQPLSPKANKQANKQASKRALLSQLGTTPQQSTTMVQADDGDTYTVRIENNTISAEHNGTPIPPDQIERNDRTITIKDNNGKVLKAFDLAVSGGDGLSNIIRLAPGNGTWDSTALSQLLGDGTAGAWGVAQPANVDPPKVMVGVTMSNVDGSLLEHLGLAEDSTFLIDRVVDGLPADKAGLKPHDIVTAIDGQTPATQEKFREILRSKGEGDKLELKVIRHGKPESITIALVAYDPAKLGINQGNTPGASNGDSFSRNGPGNGNPGELIFGLNGAMNNNWTAEARKHIEEALRELHDNPNLQPDKIKAEAQRALEKALKSLEETKATLRDRVQTWRTTPRGDDRMGVYMAPDAGNLFVRPRAQQQDDLSNKQLDRLSTQLDRLNKRLDELEKRLAEKDHR